MRLFVMVGLLLSATAVSAQQGALAFSSSADAIVDPGSAAMGDAGVGGAGDAGRWLNNPAALGGLTGIGFNGARRNLHNTAFQDDLNIYSGGVWFGGPIGTFAIHFDRFDLGHSDIQFENGTFIGTVHLYNHTVALSYAHSVIPSLQIGGTLKQVQWFFIADSSGGNIYQTNEEFAGLQTSRVVMDLGAIYSFGSPFMGGDLRDSLHIGLNLQNYIRLPKAADRALAPSAALRAGVRYTLRSDTGWFRGAIDLDYMHQLQDRDQGFIPLNFLLTGAELTLWDALHLRGGLRVEPYANSTIRLTYGAGLDLPFHRFGIDIPFGLHIDYSSAPRFEFYQGEYLTTYDLGFGIVYKPR
ncbi:MAG: hypothetical protein ABIQ57_17150 [Candidatus Kapaibacterium sp.]